MIATYLYPTYILIALIIVLLIVPRRDFKEYFLYGFLFGGLGDVVVVGIMQNLLGIIWFKNAGIFNILGQNLLSPPSWILTVMIFLRLLPRRQPFLYVYVPAFAVFSVAYGYLVHNGNLFDFVPWFYPFYAFLTFLIWWSVITWVFLKTSSLATEPISSRTNR